MTGPEPLFRRRTPRVTEETVGPGYTCPTPCDDDCEAVCHESHAADIDRLHPVEQCEHNARMGRAPIPDGWYPTGCSCLNCDAPYWPTFGEFGERITKGMERPPIDDEHSRIPVRMALCPICGNKRCPGAADHHNICKASNMPGQPKSLYPELPPVAEFPSKKDKETQKKRTSETQLRLSRRRRRNAQLAQAFVEKHEAMAGHPLADTPIHTHGPLEGQPIEPETEEEKRERYLANRDDPEEWG